MPCAFSGAPLHTDVRANGKVAYQRILQLTYVDELLAALKALFVKYYEPFLTSFVASLHTAKTTKTTILEPSRWNFAEAFSGWDQLFDKLLRGLEDKAAQVGTYFNFRNSGAHADLPRRTVNLVCELLSGHL